MDLNQIETVYRSILGPFPERVPLEIEHISEEACDGFSRTLISWNNDAAERVHGYLLELPGDKSLRPAVMAFHGHGSFENGKKSTAGVDMGDKPCLGPDLARRGFRVLCGDAICWGHRQSPDPEHGGSAFEQVTAMRLIAEGRCMAGQYVWDAIRQCDVLQSLKGVDGERIGAIGISMGSGHSWLSAMVEKRIRVLVGISSFYTYKALYAPPIRHCYMNHLPNVLKHGLETWDLFRLIAPRPFLMINGSTEIQDPVEATQELYDKARPAWEAAGAGDDFQLHFHEGGHGLTPASRELAYEWLTGKLKP